MKHLYTVLLDQNRIKIMYAKNKRDLLSQCKQHYPEATVSGYWRKQS